MISYKTGYKYQLVKEYKLKISICPKYTIDIRFIKLTSAGRLEIRAGYAWDGPSGPTIDTKNFMRGSLVHDALYQLMRLGLLDQDCREPADKILRSICREDGMSWVRAWYAYTGVRLGAAYAASIENVKKVITAP